MKDVVIVSACRTAIGAFGGTLRDMNAATIPNPIAAIKMSPVLLPLGEAIGLSPNNYIYFDINGTKILCALFF